MKAVILAAGRGTRMGRLTENLPKAMLVYQGRTLLQRQLGVLRGAGIRDIVVVTGFAAEKISYPNVTYFHNDRFAETNMVESLLCARSAFGGGILVAYSDILYSTALADRVIRSDADIGVAVDEAWRDLWMMRFGTTETDLESLVVSDQARILDIGRPVASSEGLSHRYIGLLKFSETGLHALLALYDAKKRIAAAWRSSGKPFDQGCMTDVLHELILSGHAVRAVVSRGGWYEFDTMRDYEAALSQPAPRDWE